jgi:hypothetical protein
MVLRDWLKTAFGGQSASPNDLPRLSGTSENTLAVGLRKLPAGERGWITLAEAARLFSSEQQDYAFGEMDEAGKARLEGFAAEHRSLLQFMPTEGRVYFTRQS